MGSKSRTKGKSAELEVVHILREHGPFPNADRDLEQVRGTDNGRDLIGCDPWCIQVKRRAKMTQGVILAGLAEAEASTTDDAMYGACIHRGDREPWMVTCRLYDLIWLAGGWPDTSGRITATVPLLQWCKLPLGV
jgi:hypothetical protein